MRIEEYITHGIFRCEIKNRFRCIVEVDGQEELCYVASSCRLSQFIYLEGKEVLLLPKGESASKTKYTLYAVKKGNGYILLNLSMANNTLQEQLHRRIFSFLGKRQNILREKTEAGYKADLYVEDSNMLIEVKTIISDRKEAEFPTVYSERSIEQLRRIKKLLKDGYKFCYMFAVLSPTVKLVTVKEDTEFYSEFKECIEAGMIYKAFSIKTSEHELCIRGPIAIDGCIGILESKN